MVRYIIRKRVYCNNWYVYKETTKGSVIYLECIGYFENWWDDGLMIINFPELVRYKSYV